MDKTVNAADLPDSKLLERITGGDREAFKTLYGRYVRQVFSFTFKLTGDSKMAEEITNDVFFDVWKGAGGFQGRSAVSTWVFGIAHNKSMNALRKKTPDPVDPEEFVRVANPGAGAEEIVEKKDRSERMKKALGELSPDHRTVLELTFFEGMSYQEIAEVMDCPVNTVKTRMFYAREKLKETLAKYGISQEDSVQ
ncbi:MAG TPA: sigma-70 family RNA polymerase sigma factor [Thermodesulfobacteriota bacterium]|nr:sigma-70 family RNA polymerase sigma factor [Thermodesulfobacteriota bacterium]